jgi:hypothetical protein
MATKYVYMKIFVILLQLSPLSLALTGEKFPRFIFPAFSTEEIHISTSLPAEHLSYEELKSSSVEVLRGFLATGEISIQSLATKELLERGDQQTNLRLIYSLKQGNVAAIEMLGASTLSVIPYLMEDVAQGSLAYYGSYNFGDAGTSGGRVRLAAVERVASILFTAEEFTGDTRACLRAIGRGNLNGVRGLSEESGYLVQWWLLNKDAFEAGKWSETKPLAMKIIYSDPKNDISFPADESWDPEKQPPYGSPAWELPESFEAWSARIVDPKRRNLDFVALSWDGKKVVEHPARSLDLRTRPGSPPDRESRKTPAPRNPPAPDLADRRGLIWGIVAAVLLLVFSIIRWMRR